MLVGGNKDLSFNANINKLEKPENKIGLADVSQAKKPESAKGLDLGNKVDVNFGISKNPTAASSITFPSEPAKASSPKEIFSGLKVEKDGELYARAEKVYETLLSQYGVV